MTDAELKRLAEAATPGPREFVDEGQSREYPMGGVKHLDGWVFDFGDDETYYPTQGTPPSGNDAEFIIVANPQAVLAFIARVEATRELLQKAVTALEQTTKKLERCSLSGGNDKWAVDGMLEPHRTTLAKLREALK